MTEATNQQDIESLELFLLDNPELDKLEGMLSRAKSIPH